jgi:tRNA G18 (ribose-2'-O)-methylase SpoU
MKQLGHYETLEKMPKLDIDCVLYICNVSCENLGLILRSADIFGANTVYYRQDNITVNNKQLLKLSRNSNIPVCFSDGIDSLLNLKNNGYQIMALEITNTSFPLKHSKLKQKTCLIIGNEKSGIPEDALDIADCSYHIEMIGGHISSLNVSIATSIALYEITQYHLSRQRVPLRYGQLP